MKKKILIIILGSQAIDHIFSKKIITSLKKNFECDFLLDNEVKNHQKLVNFSNMINIYFVALNKISCKKISILDKLLISLFCFKCSSISLSYRSIVFGKNPKKILLLPFLFFFSPFYNFLKKISLRFATYEKELENIFGKKKYNHCLIITGGFGNAGISLIKSIKKRKIFSSVMFPGMDNVYSKVPMFHFPDKVFVWSKQMKSFTKKIYPSSDIVISGVAQYQPYYEFISKKNQNYLIKKNREIINKMHNLDKKKKIILYAGPVHIYDELKDLDIICDTLKNSKIDHKYQVLFRPHPHRKYIKADNFYTRKYKNIFIDTTVTHNYKKSLIKSNTYMDSMTDLEYFVKLLPNIDLIVSPLSTMIMEAAIFDKPCVVVGYGGLKNKYLKEALMWGHFDTLKDKKWFATASNDEELSHLINLQLRTKYKKNMISNDTLNIVDKKTLKFDYELVNNLN